MTRVTGKDLVQEYFPDEAAARASLASVRWARRTSGGRAQP
ncbi:hypothetical protein WMF38_04720 [Sorangium sp. So ce118]